MLFFSSSSEWRFLDETGKLGRRARETSSKPTFFLESTCGDTVSLLLQISTTLDLDVTELEEESADVWMRELLDDVRLCSSALGSVLLDGNVSSEVLKRRSNPEFGVVDRCFSSTMSSVLFMAWIRSRIERDAHADGFLTSDDGSADFEAII